MNKPKDKIVELKEHKDSSIDSLVEELKDVVSWKDLLPDYDDDSLMVHWSNVGVINS